MSVEISGSVVLRVNDEGRSGNLHFAARFKALTSNAAPNPLPRYFKSAAIRSMPKRIDASDISAVCARWQAAGPEAFIAGDDNVVKHNEPRRNATPDVLRDEFPYVSVEVTLKCLDTAQQDAIHGAFSRATQPAYGIPPKFQR